MADLCNLINKVTGCGIPEGATTDKITKATFYKVVVPLDKALDNEKLSIVGEFLTVGSIRGAGNCEIRLNHPNGTLIDLREIRELQGHFEDVYFTTGGDGYECILYIATSLNSTIRTGEAYRVDATVVSGSVMSKNYIRRFSESYNDKSIVITDFNIRNTHAVNGIDIGVLFRDKLPSVADFRTYGWRIIAQESFKFAKVDLHTLGYISTVDDAHVQIKYLGSILE